MRASNTPDFKYRSLPQERNTNTDRSDRTKLQDYCSMDRTHSLAATKMKNNLTMIKLDGAKGNFIDPYDFAYLKTEIRNAGTLRQLAQHRLSILKNK